MADDEVIVKKTKKRTKSKEKRIKEKDDEIPLSPESNAVRVQTKAKFDQLLQKAVTEYKKGDKKKKGKSNAADIVLSSLKKGEGLRKESDDTSIIANTYDPDAEIKNEKSNRRKQRRIEESGSDNLAFEDDSPQRNRKKKSPRKKENREDSQMSLSELATSPREEKRKKKKTKQKFRHTEEEDEHAGGSGCQSIDDLDPSREDLAEDEQETKRKKVKKKKKKKRKEADGSQVLSGEENEQAMGAAAEGEVEEGADVDEEEEAEPTPRDIPDEGRILGIHVHRTDKLKSDFYIAHPLVRLHIIDVETGNYLKKQHKDRPVTWFYETKNENVDYILPIMSQPFDFKKQKSVIPCWEELMVFNENFNWFIQEDPRVIIIYEVLDFVSFNTATRQYHTAKQEGGWHRIAWAFLKVLGANSKLNTDKKVRLQLFEPPIRFRPKAGQLEVYQWWKAALRIKYPATLYVTVKGIIPPGEVEPAGRSMFATQQEAGRLTYKDLQRTSDLRAKFGKSDGGKDKSPAHWGRLPGQVCKVPNSLSLNLLSGKKGCFVVKFSKDGRNLACGCHDKEGYPILIYEIPSGHLKGKFLGHYSIIYDLCWSKDGSELLSASSDGTARIWDVNNFTATPIKMFPHPGFVYTARFHIRVQSIVVSGGYDRVIRIWSTKGETLQATLLQELDSHKGHINAICFDEEGQKMFTADSVGTIHMWNVYVTDKPNKKAMLRDWTHYREICDDEIKGNPINYLELHPNGRRLLVHCRDNTIRLLDLRVFAVMQRFMGALNFREQLRSRISPCGSFVISGSEDASAYVWNAETGDQVAMYSELNYKQPVSCVDFHPHEHMVVFCAFGENHPILVYTYDHKVAELTAGFSQPVEEAAAERAAGGKVSLRTASMLVSMTTGRPRSSGMLASTPQEAQAQRENATLREELSLQGTARLEKITKKLESVQQLTGRTPRAASPDRHPLAVHPQDTWGQATTSMLSTWGSTFDRTALLASPTRNAVSPSPAAFSPHAPHTLDVSKQQQQMASQSQYLKQSQSGWRPGWSPLGRQGSVGPRYSGQSPQLALSTNSPGKAQFSFQAGPGKVTSLEERQVVALYDYQAQRSDELSINRNDVITVLYKDNENWWMGELPNGQQGFFPANYVCEKRSVADEEEADEDENEDKMTTAVVTQSGELKFISGNDESDKETPRKGRRRRRKQGTQESTVEFEDTGKAHRLNKMKPRKLIESTA